MEVVISLLKPEPISSAVPAAHSEHWRLNVGLCELHICSQTVPTTEIRVMGGIVGDHPHSILKPSQGWKHTRTHTHTSLFEIVWSGSPIQLTLYGTARASSLEVRCRWWSNHPAWAHHMSALFPAPVRVSIRVCNALISSQGLGAAQAADAFYKRRAKGHVGLIDSRPRRDLHTWTLPSFYQINQLILLRSVAKMLARCYRLLHSSVYTGLDLNARFERRRTELVFQCGLPHQIAISSCIWKMSVFKTFSSCCFLVFFIAVSHFLFKLEDIKAECALNDWYIC